MFIRLSITFMLCIVVSACGQDEPEVGKTPGLAAPAAVSAALPEAGSLDIPMGRLSALVEPLHYRLDLKILPDESHFSGTVEIDLRLTEPLSRFYLHGRYFENVTASLRNSAGETLQAQYMQVDDSGVARIDLPRSVNGPATLRLSYTAPFNQSLEGLYKVTAGDQAYAFTQFEAISAREAFPGFDEPAFKVPFDISLVVHESHAAITNTLETRIELLDNGLKKIHFATTKPLPTYLVAFAVGPLDVVDADDLPPTAVRDRPVPLRGVAVAGRGSELAFALENTRGLLEAMEAYFGMPYPYAKLDLIAVPDFGAGAMENAAAITYRDSILLVDPNARPQTKRLFFVVHGHELAHQWFGDLVTPRWWDDIWLNEAFATWMAYVALDIWQPGDHYRRQLGEGARQVMNSDSMITARQIRQPVTSNHDIANAFDGITYRKGGAVLSMFESFLGRDTFRAGVQEYMRRHAWQTATADDFIEALASQSRNHQPDDVRRAFLAFLEQPGLPMVEATLACEGDSTGVRLRQSRYLPLGSRGDTAQQWELPICLKYRRDGTSAEHCLVMREADSSIDLGTGPCPDFLLPNAGGAGYFRWSLDTEGWQKLLGATADLTVDELMSMSASLDGAFNAGAVDVGTYLQVARRLSSHPNYLIATAPLDQLGFIYEQVADEAQREQLRAEFTDIYGSVLDRVGLAAPEGNDQAQMQALVTEFMAIRARLPELRETLRKLAWEYTGYPANPGVHAEGLNDNLLGTALAIAVQDDARDAGFSHHLETVLRRSDNAIFRGRALDALGLSSHPDYRERLLQLVLSPDLRDNEFYRPVSQQMAEAGTRDLTWDWIRQNMDALLGRLPEWSRGRMASYGQYYCDPQHREEVRLFFEPLVDGLQGGPRSLSGALETIDLCIAKAAHHRPGLEAYLGD